MKNLNTLLFSFLSASLLSSIQAATVSVTQVTAIGSGTDGVEYNLTDLGAADWQIFTGNTVAPTDEMSGGAGIGALTYDEGSGLAGLVGLASGKTPNYTWTNGTNQASQTNGGENTLSSTNDTSSNLGQTFTLSVDATNSGSELYLWILGENVSLDISGTISGTGTTDTFTAGAGGNSPFFGLFMIDFASDAVSDTLTVDIEKVATQGGANSRFGIQAAALTVVPEPSSLALMGIALVGLLVSLKRRKA